jgi:hypothetical protein
MTPANRWAERSLRTRNLRGAGSGGGLSQQAQGRATEHGAPGCPTRTCVGCSPGAPGRPRPVPGTARAARRVTSAGARRRAGPAPDGDGSGGPSDDDMVGSMSAGEPEPAEAVAGMPARAAGAAARVAPAPGRGRLDGRARRWRPERAAPGPAGGGPAAAPAGLVSSAARLLPGPARAPGAAAKPEGGSQGGAGAGLLTQPARPPARAAEPPAPVEGGRGGGAAGAGKVGRRRKPLSRLQRIEAEAQAGKVGA